MQSSPEELERIRRVLNGEQHLFHELIRPYERAVYMAAVGLLGDPGEAEDAAQETMLKAYRALRSFRGDSRFGTWLISIAMNEARSRLRKRGKVALESLDAPEDDRDYTPYMLADWREVPSESLERKELAAHIERAIANLSPAYRQAFLLRDKDEMSIEEIAQALGITPNLVKVRLFRARMSLQKELAPYLKREVAPGKRWFSRPGGRP